MTSEEEILYSKVVDWFEENLPNPPFYVEGNPDKAITWFKNEESSKEMLLRIQPLIELLDKYQIEYDIVNTNYPGIIIYQDQYQIAVI